MLLIFTSITVIILFGKLRNQHLINKETTTRNLVFPNLSNLM